MSTHWTLALRYAAMVLAVAVVVGGIIWFVYGGGVAGAFGYGVGIGLVSFVSMAITVSMLAAPCIGARLVGILSFPVRYGFAVIALGVPAYFGLWPVLAMLGGFAGVYLAENVVLLPGVLNNLSTKRGEEASVPYEVERRVED